MSSVSNARYFRGRSDIADQLLGELSLDPTVIKHYEDYELIYKVRHDIIHSLICDSRGFNFGERSIQVLEQEYKILFQDKTYYDLIKNQTPDIFEYDSKSFTLIEISISAASKAEHGKTSKYSLLIHFLERNNFKVHFEVIIINPRSVFLNKDQLNQFHKISDPTLGVIQSICQKTFQLLELVHKTEKGREWRARFLNIIMKDETLDYSMEDVIKRFKMEKNKPFFSEHDLKALLNSNPSINITDEDENFLDIVSFKAMDIKDPYSNSESFDEKMFWGEFDKFKKFENGDNPAYTSRTRPIFPLPYIEMDSVDAVERSLDEDYWKNRQICSIMINSGSTFLNRVGQAFLNHADRLSEDKKTHNAFILRIRFDNHLKKEIAIEGPGRKKFIKQGDPDCLKKQLENRAYCLDHSVDVSYIEPLSFWLSHFVEKETHQDFGSKCEYLSKLSNTGLNYVKLCQSIYREINVNALRKERKDSMLLKPVGIEGVYVLIYPGSKLRGGEITSQVWFKIIINASNLINTNPFPKAFRMLLNHGGIYHSEWLSVDAHRLDQYLRCYDKILISYYSILNTRYRTSVQFTEGGVDSSKSKDNTIYEAFHGDDSNVLGLIILTYMEDKRSTSKMLQIIRYVLMTSLSIYKYYNSVMKKMVDPIRSQLQLFYIKKSVSFIKTMSDVKISEHMRTGPISYDPMSKTFVDKKAGSLIKIPRIISRGSNQWCDFTETLCEMYFCMLFNKNQDDPTHASMQILDKMLEGEKSKNEVKENGMHLGYSNEMDDVDYMYKVVDQPHEHQFSAKALEIGSILFMKDNHLDSEETLKICSLKRNIDKTIDEFATFKSSSINENLKFNPENPRQNKRRRCIGGVIQLLEEGNWKSSQIANSNKDHKTSFQVFKKNQIGGPREILILPIEKRIMINILESLSRNLCYLDSREMLTHGDDKIKSMKASLYEMRRLEKSRCLIYYNFDKSRWGPTFMPIQFIYLFSRFKEQIPKTFNYITHLMIAHQNKICLYPERLIKIWMNDPMDKRKHFFNELLQKEKEKVLKTGDIYFENESNMGQGILHYTSSYLHCCLLSFRDAIYQRMLRLSDLEIEDDHRDMVSSDDSLTIQSLKIKQMNTTKLKIKLFLKAQYITELLFNVRTSKAKSSISAIIGEFNSIFFSNMTIFPTLFKFALSSVHPPNTDSFYRMVKESYISSRQIMENGGSLELYFISNCFNKKYCEEIYHTNKGNINDLNKFGINKFPYQLGYYPLFDPSLMLCFGPEFHNYCLYKDYDNLNVNEKRLFLVSHKVIKGDIVETLASLEDGDTIMGGLLRIEAQIRPMKMLSILKSQAPLKNEDLLSRIIDDPIMVIKEPENLNDTIFRTCLKLYQNSASEALKNNPASIYFGRMPATASAKAFIIPNENNTPMTYRECLQKLLHEEVKDLKLDEIIKFIYPRHKEYDMYIDYKNITTSQKTRDPFEIQTILNLELHRIHTKLTFRIRDILSYFWFNRLPEKFSEAKIKRDWSILEVYYPLLKPSLEQTRDQFSGQMRDKIKSLLMLIMKLHNLKDRTIKAILYGQNSRQIRDTVQELNTNNMYSGLTTNISEIGEFKNFERIDYDELYWWHNYVMLCIESKVNINWKEIIFNSTIKFDIFMMDPTVSINTKKRVLMLLLASGRISDVESWSEQTDTLMHYWEVPQIRNHQGEYSGNFILYVFKGKHIAKLSYNESGDKYSIVLNSNLSPEELYRYIEEFCRITHIDMKDLWDKLPNGEWILENKQIFRYRKGKMIKMESVLFFEFPLIGDILIEDNMVNLNDPQGNKIMGIPIGLIPTSYINRNSFEDFPIFNTKMTYINKLGAFSSHFHVLYHPQNELLECLDDLECIRPNVSPLTKERLNLRDGWATYDLEEYQREINSEVSINDQTWYNNLISLEPEEIKEVMQNMDDEYSYLKDFYEELKSQGLFQTFYTRVEVVRTKELYYRIKDLKYSLIGSQFLSEMKINRATVRHIASTYKNPNITHAMVAIYDRTYTHKDMRSPENVIFMINENIEDKFNLRDPFDI